MYDILYHCAFLQHALKLIDDREQRESREVNGPAACTTTTHPMKIKGCVYTSGRDSGSFVALRVHSPWADYLLVTTKITLTTFASSRQPLHIHACWLKYQKPQASTVVRVHGDRAEDAARGLSPWNGGVWSHTGLNYIPDAPV